MPPKTRVNRKTKQNDSKCAETSVKDKTDSSQIKRDYELGASKEQRKTKIQCNIVNRLEKVQRSGNTYGLHKTCRDILFRKLSSLCLYRSEAPFNRRITFIEWHPKHPETLAVASKGGDILLWNYGKTIYTQQMIPGKGAGASVQAIKFHPEKQMEIYSTAIDGTVCAWNYHNKTCKVFLQTNHYDKWYTSLDVCFSGGHFVAGDNCGQLTMLSLEGQKMWSSKLHKSKITHAEYNPKVPWLLTTASVDRTVKMWDIRYLKGKESVLAVLEHDHPVNSAYYSLTDSSRLLTTDQNSQLRIYKAPLWQLENKIAHPHRHFQHITPIKATWHPLEDIVVVGRYPDKKFEGYEVGELRTIDFFDVETGCYRYGLTDPGIRGIVSLNRFNILGDTLASGMGLHILIWRPDRANDIRLELIDKMYEKLNERGRKRPSKQTKTSHMKVMDIGPSHSRR